MLIPKPPKETLVDSMVYRSYKGQGDYNKPEFEDDQLVNYVRIDRNPSYSFSTQGKQLLFNATVFCYNGLTEPLPTFKEQDVLVFDGVEHTVISAALFKEPFVDQVYSYELGVV